MPSVVLHYAELALKGRNRPWFINTLVRVVRMALAGLSTTEVRAVTGRVVVAFSEPSDWPEIAARLERIPGISNFLLAHHVAPDVDALADAIAADLPQDPVPSFRVAARRADKRFPLSSPEIERLIGRRVQQARGWKVDLSRPAFVIRVEVLTDAAFYAFERREGTGGLPVGTGGRLMALLSGGIDSPVAAWRLIRRGCRTDFVHFHSYPILSRASQDKARQLAAVLTRSQLRSRLHLVAFGGIQQQVVVSVPPPLRVVIYRRMMVRIAEELARRSGARALVTGDAVGQVASQTIDNLVVIGSVATMPVLRPLVGMDKEEITADAQRLGTYETSILPDQDCCTLFTPRFPATHAWARDVEAAEEALDVPGLVAQAIETVEVETFRFPGAAGEGTTGDAAR